MNLFVNSARGLTLTFAHAVPWVAEELEVGREGRLPVSPFRDL